MADHRKQTEVSVSYTHLDVYKRQEHLIEVDRKVRGIVELTITKMAQDGGVTEELKASDPMKWTGLMNNLKQAAEEAVIHDLIYN